MQRDSSPNGGQKTLCHSCNRYILNSNFLIHEGRCQRMSQLRSSRVSQNNSQKKENNQEKQQNISFDKRQNSHYSYPNMNKKEYIGSIKKTSSNLKNNQSQEKIPCPFCGYMQSLIELDTHPNQCQHREVDCDFCNAKFPNSLMNDHKQICQKNPRNIQRNRRNQMRRNQNQMRRNQEPHYHEPEDEMMPMFMQPRSRNMYNPSPLMNFFNDPFFNEMLMGGRQRQQQNGIGPSFNMIQFSSNNGQPQRVIIRSNSSNPSTFIQLINMLAQRANPNQNPGLNEQQLNRLSKVKYHKKNPQPDLCTICYCQFQQNQEMIELKCKHMFHQECIFQWLKRVSTCPVCKKKLKEGVNSHQENQFQEFEEPEDEYQEHNHPFNQGGHGSQNPPSNQRQGQGHNHSNSQGNGQGGFFNSLSQLFR